MNNFQQSVNHDNYILKWNQMSPGGSKTFWNGFLIENMNKILISMSVVSYFFYFESSEISKEVFWRVSKSVLIDLSHLPLVPHIYVSESGQHQILTCRQFGAKPLSEPVLGYCQLDHWGQTSFNLNKIQIFAFMKMHLNLSSVKRGHLVH